MKKIILLNEKKVEVGAISLDISRRLVLDFSNNLSTKYRAILDELLQSENFTAYREIIEDIDSNNIKKHFHIRNTVTPDNPNFLAVLADKINRKRKDSTRLFAILQDDKGGQT